MIVLLNLNKKEKYYAVFEGFEEDAQRKYWMAYGYFYFRRHYYACIIRRFILPIDHTRGALSYCENEKRFSDGYSFARFIYFFFCGGKKVGNNKIVMKWSAFFGFLLLTCSFIILFFNASLFSILLTLVLGGIGIGAALPSLDALITEGIEKEERGTITSLYSSMRFVGVAAGPPLYTLLMKWSDMAVFQTSLGVSAVGAILVLKAIKPKPEGGVKLKKAEV